MSSKYAVLSLLCADPTPRRSTLFGLTCSLWFELPWFGVARVTPSWFVVHPKLPSSVILLSTSPSCCGCELCLVSAATVRYACSMLEPFAAEAPHFPVLHALVPKTAFSLSCHFHFFDALLGGWAVLLHGLLSLFSGMAKLLIDLFHRQRWFLRVGFESLLYLRRWNCFGILGNFDIKGERDLFGWLHKLNFLSNFLALFIRTSKLITYFL